MLRTLLQRSVNLIPYRLRKLIRRIPGLKQLQRHLVAAHLDGTSFEHEINVGPARGLRYPVTLPIDKQIWIGTYEHAFGERLAASVTPGAVCYDIGGFRGFFTGVMACRGASEVHVFEPMPDNVEQIRRMAALNPRLPIHVHPLALAERAGEADFVRLSAAGDSMGKLRHSEFDSGDAARSIVKVRVETLDALIERGLAPAALIKLDVEGAEALVLQGAAKLLREHRPRLFIEAHSHELARKCVELLRPHGYSFRVLETGRPPDFVTEPPVSHLEATS